MINGGSTAIWSALAAIPGTAPKNLQAIGSAAINLTSYGPVTSPTFVDWPAEIGIDNMTITGACLPGTTAPNPNCRPHGQTLPEPGTMLLFGIALAALAAGRRRIGHRTRTASR